MSQPSLIYYNLRPSRVEHQPTLFAAHRLGYRVLLVTDQPALDVPRDVVREQVVVDTYDVGAALAAGRRLARAHRVDGVLTWSDRDVNTVALLAEELGLPGPPPEAARIARNKYRMRQAMSAHPELVPRFRHVGTWVEAEAAAADIGYPAILKPTVAAGSIAIFELHNADDLLRAFDTLTQHIRPTVNPIFGRGVSQLIYEEFLTGTEHSVEGYVRNEEVTVAGITDKETLPPFHTEVGHVFPTALGEPEREAVLALTSQVIKVFGLDDCVFHLECKVDKGRAKLIEAAARGGGDYITSHLVPLATGQSFHENAIRVATGAAPVAAGEPVFHAGVKKIVTPDAGVFEGFAGLAEANATPGVEHIVLERAIGEHVAPPPEDYTGCVLGSVIARAATRAELVHRLDTLTKTLAPVIR
ncbi:MAG TPA: ATP-grasp domain-containing protein [Actinophytocola sp.]|uniref:ATP-grasp domain-containing protein n=1 Tax=Actinophytocola sp. TaxID=1872138 RepID=UPI002DDD7011|nr:ATP-grasp domain-containing protein [Actinophytocola sp.]HEV2783899.1 ATP-grasp domain-containing protein [Actinophytocola sp.]